MMFDNSSPPSPDRREVAKQHLPLVVLVLACVGVAAGVHLASVAVVVVAAGHLVLAGLLIAIRRLRQHRVGISTP